MWLWKWSLYIILPYFTSSSTSFPAFCNWGGGSKRPSHGRGRSYHGGRGSEERQSSALRGWGRSSAAGRGTGHRRSFHGFVQTWSIAMYSLKVASLSGKMTIIPIFNGTFCIFSDRKRKHHTCSSSGMNMTYLEVPFGAFTGARLFVA